jgi:hypothetical protein
MAKQNNSSASDFPKLAAPAQRALAGAGYWQLKQLAKVRESEVKGLHGIGPNALKALKVAMKAQGLAFAPEKK